MAEDRIEIDIAGDTSEFDSAIEGVTNKVSTMSVALGNVLADLGKKAISSLGGIVDSAMETGKAFENSMSNVTALQQAAGASAEDIASLKKVAEDYGASTQYTMAECADALGYMALAGWDAEQSANALPGVLSLSAASGMDLANAADMVTDYMSAFSKSVSDYTGEALTAAEFSDKLAYAQANSNTSAAQLGEAYKNCAANLNAAGQQMDTVTAILGTMANQGKKGSESGTALSAMMRDITNSMEDGAISINGTTVAVADASGNYRDLIAILADVESATNGMGETERNAALSSVFTADSLSGLNLVLNAGVDSVYALEAGLSDCAGTADKAAATLNDNLDGDLKYMESAFDAVKNSIYEGICPALRTLVQSVTSDVAPQLQELVTGLLGVASGTEGAGEQMQFAVSALAEWAIHLVSDCLPKILTALTDVLGQLVLAIVNNAPALFNALLDSLFGMADALTVITPKLLTGIAELLQQMLSKLFASIPKMVQTATEFFGGFLDALLSLDLAGAFTELLDLLVRRLIYAVPKLADTATEFFGSIMDAVPDMLSGMEQMGDVLADSLKNLIVKILPVGMQIIKTLISGMAKALPQLWDSEITIMDTLCHAFQSVLPKLYVVAKQLLEALVNGLMTALPKFLNDEQKLMTMLIETFTAALPWTLNLGIQILETLITGLMSAVPELVTFVQNFLNTLVTFIQENLPVLVTVAVNLLQTLITLILENLPMLVEAALNIITALANALLDSADLLANSAVNLINTLVQMMLENLGMILEVALKIIMAIVNGLTENLPNLIISAIGIILALVNGIMQNLPMIAKMAVNILMVLATALLDSLDLLIEAALGLIDFLIQTILENLDVILDVALEIILAIAQGLMDNLPDLITSAIKIVIALANGIVENLPKLIDAVIQIINALVTFFGEHYGDFIQASYGIILALCDGIILNLPDLLVAIGKVTWALITALQDIDWLQLGMDILAGLANGFLNGLSVVMDTIETVKDNIVDGFKTFFGIHSPSRVMRDEIGKFLSPGVAVGVEDSVDSAKKDINKSLNDMLNGIDMDSLQMQLNSAVQMQGYESVMPSVLERNFYCSQDTTSERNESNSLESPRNMQMNPKFSIYIGDTEIKNFVISAIDEANVISGGVCV
ncbi:MAG: phage tail tape measure protein [Oscillospiraceae bacterium]|nr:phage tail tape measure protein [Oscillospiraceae bacterium]